MKRFLHSMMLLAVMLLPLASIAQTSWTVADGTTTHAKVPLDFYNCDGSGNKQAQMLYPASLLTDMNGATIASITFYHQNSSATKTLTASTWYIRMGETTETDLSAGFSSASLTTVYSGNLVVTQGVVTFEFSTPYTYNGGNLIVEIQTTGASGNWFGSINQGFVGVDAIGSTYSNMSSPAHTAFLPKTVFAEAPTCFPVTDLTIGQATTSSLTLTWADADNASASYDIYNMADTSLVASSISGTTYTVDNLNANTGYAFAVVANCGGGDLAAAVTVSGRTACDEMVLPYFNDFEGEVNGSSSNDNSFVFCWTRTITNRGAYYYPYVSSTGGKNSPKCLYFTSGSSTYSYSDLSLAVLPQVSANYQISNLRLSFWSKTSSGDRPIYVGVMTDPTDAATLVYVDTIMVNTTWGLYTSYFANYAGEGTYVVIAQPRYTDPSSSYATATIYVDEVTLEEVPSCLEPGAPVVTGRTYEAATIAWGVGSNETQWQMQYKKTTETEWTLVSGILTDTVYTVTGLDANTTYQFQVRAYCSAAEQSGWTIAASTTTLCAPESLPWTADYSTLTTCWNRYTGMLDNVLAGTANLSSTTSGWNTTSTAISDFGSHLKLNIYGTSCTSWVVTPVIDLTSDVALMFDAALTDYGNTNVIENFDNVADDRFVVLITTDGGSNWNILKSWGSAATDDYAYNTVATTGESYTIPLTQYVGQEIRIAFYGESLANGGDNDFHIANISLDVPPSCLRPTGVSASVLVETADISWTAGDAETAWDLRYKAASDENWTVVSNITANPYTISGLTAATTYEAQVRAICSASSLSDWSATATFTTLAALPAALPYTCDFEGEGTDGWELINGTLTNQWYVGTAVNNGGTKALYVSNDGGVSNAYTNSSSTAVYATRDIVVAEDGTYDVSYDWMTLGENGWDFIRVALAPNTVSLNASTTLISGLSKNTVPAGWIALDGGSELSGQSTWQTYSTEAALAAGNYKFVIAWRNDGSGGSDPAGSIDNISIALQSCQTPSDLAATNITSSAISLSWNAGTASEWSLRYKAAADADWTVVSDAITTPAYTINGLTPATTYNVQVSAICGSDAQSQWVSGTFVTECATLATPWDANFGSSLQPCWAMYAGSLSGVMDGSATLDNTTGWNFGTVEGFDGYIVKTNIYGGNCYRWLVTPTLSISANDALNFDYAYAAYSYSPSLAQPAQQTGDDDRFVVLAKTGNTWNILREWNNVEGSAYVLNNITTTPTSMSIDLSNYAGQEIQLAFYVESSINNADNDLYLGNINVAAAAPQIDTIEVVADYYNSIYYASGNDWYIQMANDDYNFNFDIVADSIVSGHTYTLADMLAEYSDGNDVNNYDVINYAAVSYTQTTVVDTLSVNAFVTATTGNVYHITYSEVIDRTIDTIDINMGLFESDVFDGQYIVDMAPADTSMIFEFVFDAAPVDGVTYTMADMEARGMSNITYEYIMPTQATYVQNTVNNVFTVEATMLDGNKFYQLHYSANAGTPTTDTIDVVATNRTEMYFAEDNDWYIKLENDDYDFYFDIVADSLVSGQTYTLADMLTNYCVGVDYTTNDDIDYAAASYTQTVVGDTMNVNAFVTATTGDVYHITYFEIIDRTIDTIDVNMAVYLPLDNGEDYFVDLANADTTIVFEFSFVGAPVNGVTYTMDDMDVVGVDYLAYANIYPSEATYVQNQANGMFTIEATALAGRKFYQIHYSVAATDPTPDSVNITVVAADTTMGTVTGSGRYEVGENVTISAIANEGYHFVAWNDQDTNATRVIVADTMDMTFTATFAANPVVADSANITVVAADTTMGTVTGSGRYEVGETITITAVANAGYEFVSWNDGSWNDGNTDATRTIVVEGDATYIATFRALEGINDAEATAAIIYTMDNNIVVKNAANQNVYVFDVTGRCVAQDLNNAEIRTFAIRNAGVYLVKVGNAVAKRVVIVK